MHSFRLEPANTKQFLDIEAPPRVIALLVKQINKNEKSNFERITFKI